MSRRGLGGGVRKRVRQTGPRRVHGSRCTLFHVGVRGNETASDSDVLLSVLLYCTRLSCHSLLLLLPARGDDAEQRAPYSHAMRSASRPRTPEEEQPADRG